MPRATKIANPPPDELTADQAVQAALEMDLERRRWLKSLIPLFSETTEPATSAAVEFARDQARIAVAERISRVARSDLSERQAADEALAAAAALAAEE
jgi:Ribonuclease G/E